MCCFDKYPVVVDIQQQHLDVSADYVGDRTVYQSICIFESTIDAAYAQRTFDAAEKLAEIKILFNGTCVNDVRRRIGTDDVAVVIFICRTRAESI